MSLKKPTKNLGHLMNLDIIKVIRSQEWGVEGIPSSSGAIATLTGYSEGLIILE